MKIVQETLHDWVNPDEYASIPHMIYFSDFNTNYPSPNRIDRIASEISECVKWKYKNAKMQEEDTL